nr:hypothetical protein GTC16762_33160 [Pigmentibacter ruber]
MKYNKIDKRKNKKLLEYYIMAIEKFGNISTVSKHSKISKSTLKKISLGENPTTRTYQKLENFVLNLES